MIDEVLTESSNIVELCILFLELVVVVRREEKHAVVCVFEIVQLDSMSQCVSR